MRKATGAFARAREPVPRFERSARRLRFSERRLACVVPTCAPERLAVAGEPLRTVRSGQEPEPSPTAPEDWRRLRPQLRVVDDVLSLDRPAVFPASKDRPILFTALAWADVLLTLDRGDFDAVIGSQFYGMAVLVPADFLIRERSAGQLVENEGPKSKA